MPLNDLNSFSLSTLIETSILLGHPLSDRSGIRNGQDNAMIGKLQSLTALALPKSVELQNFCVAAFDFLPYQEPAQTWFQVIEVNGMGFLGSTNLPDPQLHNLLQNFYTLSQTLDDSIPLILLPFGGDKENPNCNVKKLHHERILYAQALKEGLIARHGNASIQILDGEMMRSMLHTFSQPTVILGYISDFLGSLEVRNQRIYLKGHPVSAIFHDGFYDQLTAKYPCPEVDWNRVYSPNKHGALFSDKGLTYQFINRHLQETSYPNFKSEITYTHAYTKDELIVLVLEYVKQNRKIVIKPHGSALGRGIEFFLKPESESQILQKIEASLDSISRFHAVKNTGFPYTICDYVECLTIPQVNHPLFGHKFELRIVVYAHDNQLKPVPSIVKIASKPYNPIHPERLMLLNNIASAPNQLIGQESGFILPLSNPETLQLIGLNEGHLEQLCRFSTQAIGSLLGLNSIPTVFTLPSKPTEFSQGHHQTYG